MFLNLREKMDTMKEEMNYFKGKIETIKKNLKEKEFIRQTQRRVDPAEESVNLKTGQQKLSKQKQRKKYFLKKRESINDLWDDKPLQHASTQNPGGENIQNGWGG